MEKNIDRLEYFLEQYPNHTVKLDPSSLNQSVTAYVRQNNNLIFRFQEADLFDEPFIEEKLQEVFQKSKKKQSITIGQFLKEWVSTDEKLIVEFADYQKMVESLCKKQLQSIQKKVVAKISQQANQRSQNLSVSTQRTSHSPQPSTGQVQKKKSHNNPSKFHASKVRAEQPENQKIRDRLRRLFDYYLRRENRQSTHATFDQLGNTFSQMPLTVWMIFNRESTVTTLVGKDEVHSTFKKFQDIKTQCLTFETFQKAVGVLMEKVHPGAIQDGWKMLGIADEQGFNNKLKALGQLPQAQGPTPQPRPLNNLPKIKQEPTKSSYLVSSPKKKAPHPFKRNNTNETDQSSSVYSSLNIDKLSKLQLDVDIPIEINQNEDQMFLKEYKLGGKNNPKNMEEGYATKALKNHKGKTGGSKPLGGNNANSLGNLLSHSPNTKKFSPSSYNTGGVSAQGLLGRMDERIKKYTRN